MAERAPDPAREDLLDALRAVREAIDIPHPATVGDSETYDAVLKERVLHTVVMLQNIFTADVDVPWSVKYLRARLAEHPAKGYKTWGEHMDGLRARRPGGAP